MELKIVGLLSTLSRKRTNSRPFLVILRLYLVKMLVQKMVVFG
ncbi:hypothetical protein JCM19294_30 [Nonlabens tegetincola]|uniref:Uncharacterized protein n=1 Tax=Nonlabens tegetincola TaxID=323273 RepID=A0A090Q367_9FLAO|nr:hypothetical protein JCM19294_30 [Nonlabens tegetincola]